MLRSRSLLALSALLLAPACSSLNPEGDFLAGDGSALADRAASADAAMEVGTVPIDAGAPAMEVGAMLIDAGAPAMEVGAMLIDAGAPATEVGAMPIDAGDPATEVGTVPIDVGTAMMEASVALDRPPAVDLPPIIDTPPVVDVPSAVDVRDVPDVGAPDVPAMVVDVPPPVDVPTVSLTDGLVVHHRFDGDTTDSAYGANGTAVGVQFVADRFNNARRAGRFSASSSGFSGSSVVIPSNGRLPVGNAPRTLAFWTVDRRNTSAWQYRSMVGWGDIMNGTRFGVSGLANLTARTDQPIFSGQSADVHASVTNIVDGRWHHLAVTYDGATLRIYVDGALSNSGGLPLNTTTRVLYIGRAPVRMSEYYDGDLDDLRIYDRALGATEISALYRDGG